MLGDAWHGEVMSGAVRRGVTWQGAVRAFFVAGARLAKVRSGEVRWGEVWQGRIGSGVARRGRVWCGEVRLCTSNSNNFQVFGSRGMAGCSLNCGDRSNNGYTNVIKAAVNIVAIRLSISKPIVITFLSSPRVVLTIQRI